MFASTVTVRRATAAVAAVVTGMCAPTVAHGAAWVSTATISDPPGQLFGAPSVAVDGQGDLWLAAPNTPPGGPQIVVYERPPGGTLVPVASQPGAFGAALAASANGTVVVAWARTDDHVLAMVRRPGGSFGAPQDLASVTTGIPSVAVLPDGTALVAFIDALSSSLSVAVSPPGGSFVANPIAGQDTPSVEPLLANDAAGNATVLFADKPSGTTARIAAADRPAGGTFGSAHTVATQSLAGTETHISAFPEALSENAAGDTVAAWHFDAGASGPAETDSLGAAAHTAGQPFGPPALLETLPTDPDHGQSTPHAVVLPNGDVATAWLDVASTNGTLHTADATRASGYAFPATPATITTSAPGLDQTALAALGDGGELALTLAPSNEAIPYLRAPGAPALVPQAPAIAPGNFNLTDPALAADGAGDAYGAVNTQPVNGTGALDVVAYDATGPVVGPIAGAGTVPAGQPQTLSVGASDTVSSVASISWSFGDGTTAAGPSVSHTWPAGGTYPVSATATDAAGNTTTVTATVVAVPPACGNCGPPAAPVISAASLLHTRFAVSSSPTATSAKAKPKKRTPPPKGTQIRFALSAPATVKLTITHTTTSHHKRRTLTDATLTRKNLKAGAIKLSFSGRIGPKALHTGAHSLKIDATGTTGLKAKPKTLKFSVVRA
jgi:PKD domain